MLSEPEHNQSLSPQYAELISDLFTEVLGKMLSPDVIKEVCGEEITLSQLHALRYLFRHGEECSVSELATGLSVTTPAATKLIDRLEKRNWVTRREDEKDHRIFHIRLTSQGHNIVEKVKTVRTNRITQIIESMSPEHRHGLLQGLETFIHAALTDDNMMEAICQHCGSEAFDSCILNRTHAERTQAQEEQVCN